MRAAFRDRVAAYLKASPGEWIDSRVLETVGGGCAWLTRVSECRTELGMTIENRQQRITATDGTVITVISQYRFVPEPEPTRTMQAPSEQRLF